MILPLNMMMMIMFMKMFDATVLDEYEAFSFFFSDFFSFFKILAYTANNET